MVERRVNMRRKILYVLGLLLAFVLVPNSVNADGGITIVRTGDTNYTSLQEAIDKSVSGDVIVLDEGTYDGDVTINKGVSLEGAGKGKTIIKGQVNVSNGQELTTISNLTISNKGMDSAGVKLTGCSNLTISNSVIQYEGYTENDYGNSDYFTGVWLDKSADQSTVSILDNSEIYAKYGVWVYGQGNDVTIKNSKITGWASLDISNGSSATSLASNNKVLVDSSTLTGYAVAGNSNEYGTIVIGGQKGLELTISDSTITNKFVQKNTQDLITFGDAYLASEEVTIDISNSKLINNDTDGASAVVNFSTEDNTTITSSNQKTIKIVGNNVLLTLSTIDSDTIIAVPKGTTLTDDILSITEEVDGYNFEGWYMDSNYDNKFVLDTIINQDTILYAKFTKEELSNDNNDKVTDTIKNNATNTSISNPKTGDINLVVILSVIAGSICILKYASKKILLKIN
jgi:uncharacterized repeat protein (TIGR02543 family)